MELLEFKKLSDTQVKCKVSISADELDNALEYVLTEQVAKQGEVTDEKKREYIEKLGYESLYFSASQLAIEESVKYASLEKEFRTVPMQRKVENISEVKKGSGFTAEFITDVFPPVKLGNYKGIEIHPLSTDVSPEMLEARIEHELSASSPLKETTTCAKIGDTVNIDFNGFLDGVAFEGGSAKEYDLVLGSNSFIPGFEDQLVGVKQGDAKDIKVTFPTNYPAENLAGKETVFKIFVHSVKTKLTPALADEYVSELGIQGVKTADEYKNYIKNQIKAELTLENDRKVTNEIFNHLVDTCEVEIPESIVRALVDRKIGELEKMAEQYGMPVEVLLSYNGIPSLTEYQKQVTEMTKSELKLSLCLDELVKSENLKVSQEEFNTEFSFIAGISKDDSEEIQKEKSERLMRSTTPDQLAEIILHKKAITLLRDNAKEIKNA